MAHQTTTQNLRYVSEFVWLPTYIGVAAIVFATVSGGTSATLALFAALLGCRVLLELLYRIVFGGARLTLRIGALAFGCQLLVWGGLIWWQIQLGTPT
jgi:hypothetical protein